MPEGGLILDIGIGLDKLQKRVPIKAMYESTVCENEMKTARRRGILATNPPEYTYPPFSMSKFSCYSTTSE